MCPPPNCVCDVSHRQMHVGHMAPGPMLPGHQGALPQTHEIASSTPGDPCPCPPAASTPGTPEHPSPVPVPLCSRDTKIPLPVTFSVMAPLPVAGINVRQAFTLAQILCTISPCRDFRGMGHSRDTKGPLPGHSRNSLS